jgi:ribosome biogenesis protein UTP30
MALVPPATKEIASQTPYQLDPEQTLRASKAILEHIRSETQRIQQTSSKKELFKADGSDSDEDATEGDEVPIWLTLSTKQHVVDRNRLKPSKIPVPHSLNASPSLNICLITADPQRALKNVVADPTFPTSLSSRINRIIGFTKLKARYKTFEQRRELLSEHDIFLADDRIITRLPNTLGKVFYKGTTKRPIPISIAALHKSDAKKNKSIGLGQKSREDKAASFAAPTAVANEIERAIDSVPVNLKPGTLVATRVGLASFTPQQLKDNVNAVVSRVIEKHVVKGWRNVKGIYIKSPKSMAIPVWVADELWAESENVDAEKETTALEAPADSLKRKRNPNHIKGPQVGQKKKTKLHDEAAEANRQVDTARKSKLAVQKASAFQTEALAA